MSTLNKFFKQEKIVLDNGKEIVEPKSKTPLIVLLIIVLLLISIKITDFSFLRLIRRGDQFFEMVKGMIPPDFSYAKVVMKPLLDTIKMSILGSLIGSILAIPFAIVASSNINKSRIFLIIIRFILSITRTLPTLIIALIATYIFDIGTFAGTIAITIFTFGIVVKMIYEQIETVDMGPFEAMEAVGATKLVAFSASIIPQILPSYFSICLYSFEINVRYAAILGYVGAGGIGLILNEALGWRQYNKVGMILLILFITVIIIEYLSKKIRGRLG